MERDMMTLGGTDERPQRFYVKYGFGNDYHVVDDAGKSVFQADSKAEAIKKSQELNGFTPADGNEQTYERQTGLEAAKKQKRS
jgi:hypothetical protein